MWYFDADKINIVKMIMRLGFFDAKYENNI